VSTALQSNEVEELVSGAVDGSLQSGDDAKLRDALAADPELKARFEKYQKAIALLKGAPREKAPVALASTIMRRVRRRRVFDRRNAAIQQAMYRVPVEIIIPLLLGVMVAALLFFAAP
jgi:anti-sigma factor RsiW